MRRPTGKANQVHGSLPRLPRHLAARLSTWSRDPRTNEHRPRFSGCTNVRRGPTASRASPRRSVERVANGSRLPPESAATARLHCGGGGNRTRVRKPSALRPYVRSPRFGVGRWTGTDALPSTPSRKNLAVQGPGSPGRPARILTVIPEPTGRDPGDRALGLFKQPARAQRCRWLLCRCLRDLRVSGPLGTRPGVSVPPSKPGRPLQHRSQ